MLVNIDHIYTPFPEPDISNKRSYIQGQPGQRKNEREYFYKINHQGQMFMDDTKVKNFITCFKDPVFLKFFYSRIRPVREREARYDEFRWVSPCGPETNFIKIDLLPIVWHKFEEVDGQRYVVDTSGTFKQLFQ